MTRYPELGDANNWKERALAAERDRDRERFLRIQAEDFCRAVQEQRDALAAHVEAARDIISNVDAGLDERQEWLSVTTGPGRPRQKLIWQAEVLDKLRAGLLRNCSAYVAMTLEAEADKLRRQAEE